METIKKLKRGLYLQLLLKENPDLTDTEIELIWILPRDDDIQEILGRNVVDNPRFL
ncbi:hypothetical protein LCGC14_0763600 [marine sediment metagenome]|uniref:Uncharacterized protein n=1 Tax=marine sediment metagenome TaxID=412755 RepID=A0A0F9QK68_9ZZZZ